MPNECQEFDLSRNIYSDVTTEILIMLNTVAKAKDRQNVLCDRVTRFLIRQASVPLFPLPNFRVPEPFAWLAPSWPNVSR